MAAISLSPPHREMLNISTANREVWLGKKGFTDLTRESVSAEKELNGASRTEYPGNKLILRL
jgi:hypothetical protein